MNTTARLLSAAAAIAVVAVIGTAGPASRAVLRALVSAAARGSTTARPGGAVDEARIGAVVAGDTEPPAVGGVQFRHADPGEPSLVKALAGVHAAPLDPPVRGSRRGWTRE